MRSLLVTTLGLVACTSTVPGAPAVGLDASLAVGADGAAGVTCAASGCGGQHRGVTVAGFTAADAAAVLAIVDRLPDPLTDGPMRIVPDHAATAMCGDLVTAPAAPPCALAWLTALDLTTGFELHLGDPLLAAHRDRLGHELAVALAREWVAAHLDQAVASYLEGWADCHPCPTDPAEPCPARAADDTLARVGGLDDVIVDVDQTVAAALATLAQAELWPGTPRWLSHGGGTCDPSDRVLAIDRAFLQGIRPTRSSASVELDRACGPTNRGAALVATTVSDAALRVDAYWTDLPIDDLWHPSGMTSAALPLTFLISAPDGSHASHAAVWSSTGPVDVVLSSCQCPSGPVVAPPGATMVCGQ